MPQRLAGRRAGDRRVHRHRHGRGRPLSETLHLTASWIWVADGGGSTPNHRNVYACFRRRFEGAGDAHVLIAADTRYDLFIDGYRIDRGTAPAGRSYHPVDTHHLHLAPGRHAIAVMVHHPGEACATHRVKAPGLIVEIGLDSGERVASDDSWRAALCTNFDRDLPVMMSHFGFYEHQRPADFTADWASVDFDDSDWHNAVVVGQSGDAPWGTLRTRRVPLLTTERIASTVACAGLWTGPAVGTSKNISDDMAARAREVGPKDGLTFPLRLAPSERTFIVFDFGREVTGHPRLHVGGTTDGWKLDLGYDETLDAHGLPNPQRTYVQFADRIELGDRDRVAEIYNARGFRYLMVDAQGGSGELRIERVELDERTVAARAPVRFECSDPALMEMHRRAWETVRLCSVDTFVDTPSRERVMWMDSYLEGLFRVYGDGDTSLWREALLLFADDVSDQEPWVGAVKGFVPSDRTAMLVSYTMLYVCSAAAYAWHSGDLATAQALWPRVGNQVQIVERFVEDDGMLAERWGGWGTFIDWSALDTGGKSTANNAILIAMYRHAALLARMLGDSGLASKWAGHAGRLRRRFNELFWDSSRSLYVDSVRDGKQGEVISQASNAIALWAGTANLTRGRDVLRRILDPSTLLPPTPGDYRLKPDFKPQTGGVVPVGTPALAFVLCHALFEHGMDAEAFAYISQIWGGPHPNGTFEEHLVHDRNTSFCHGWSAGPMMLLPGYVLGVRPIRPGWEAVVCDIRTGDLSSASGTVHTPRGPIDVEWEYAGSIRGRLRMPHGIRFVDPGRGARWSIESK